jgi:hypothetical protein
MVEKRDSPQFEGVKETVNGEIDVFEVFEDGGTTQITDLDRLEERIAGGFQIAEHKATQKESLFSFKELDEIINTFFERDYDSGNLRLKRGATRQNVIDIINNKSNSKQKKDFQRARHKYIQFLVNKAKTIKLTKKEQETGIVSVNLIVSGRYTGSQKDDDPQSLKRKVAEVKVIVFRFAESGEQNHLIPISEHTEKTMQLYIGLAQAEIDETYRSLELKIEFTRQIKST